MTLAKYAFRDPIYIFFNSFQTWLNHHPNERHNPHSRSIILEHENTTHTTGYVRKLGVPFRRGAAPLRGPHHWQSRAGLMAERRRLPPPEPALPWYMESSSRLVSGDIFSPDILPSCLVIIRRHFARAFWNHTWNNRGGLWMVFGCLVAEVGVSQMDFYGC